MTDNKSFSQISIPTIYQVTPYTLYSERRCKYPTYKHRREPHGFFRTKEEALFAVRTYSKSFAGDRLYCIVVTELPLDTSLLKGESFSEQIFLGDGTLWCERPYAQITPRIIPPEYGEIAYDNYLYGKCGFYGRRPEEILFREGDIIEIFCYEGNGFWDDGHVELAIVVDTPPTVKEMTKRINRYLVDAQHLTGDRGFDVGIQFSAGDDTYKVIPAYCSLSDDVETIIDYCPTHCAFVPRFKVSSRMRSKLLRQLERVKEL